VILLMRYPAPHPRTGLQNQYSSTIDCHTELFEAARVSPSLQSLRQNIRGITILKKTYHASSHEPSISLTRAAVLLSYWSPFTSEQQSNSYWIDQAFINARAAILQELDYASISISPGRRRIIWWCCQLRDVLLSFALRRINTLHTEPLTRKMVCADDFGAESTTPCFLSPLSKTLAINNFIRQCELSLVMRELCYSNKLRICKILQQMSARRCQRDHGGGVVSF